jgi:hypothetical protein
MSKETIPEQVIVKCDFCNALVGKTENTIKLGGNSLDNGVAVGPAYKSGTYDCCYICYNKITTLMGKIKNEL